MKIILTSLFVFLLSGMYADTTIVPRNQQYFYQSNNYYPPYNYYPPFDYYTPYEPFNGPMRGPNSIEGHKSRKEQLRDLRNR